MANEAVIIELLGSPPGEPIQMTVANATSISGGTLMVLSDPRTAAASTATTLGTAKFAGILAHDKLANDGSTTAAVYTNGIFDLTSVTTVGAESAIAVGDYVVMSGANTIKTGSGTCVVSGAAIGYALETAGSAEVIAVRVKI